MVEVFVSMEDANEVFFNFINTRIIFCFVMSEMPPRYEYFIGERNLQRCFQRLFGEVSGYAYSFLTGWFVYMLSKLLIGDKISDVSCTLVILTMLLWIPLVVILIYHEMFRTLATRVVEE